jgi:8-oxo-dGTP pyrophosphatase MutT (NUDIX family)
MVKHRVEHEEYWCLPGGGREENESPAEAAVRELAEECGVDGVVLRETSVWVDAFGDRHSTFLVDIGTQEPRLGHDPELPPENQILADVRWVTLDQIPERDRSFLWAAGLLGVEPFARVAESWGGALSCPSNK